MPSGHTEGVARQGRASRGHWLVRWGAWRLGLVSLLYLGGSLDAQTVLADIRRLAEGHEEACEATGWKGDNHDVGQK